MILVTGATGTIGELLARRLAEDAIPFRALVRRSGVTVPGAETVVADLDDPSTLPGAFDGIDQLFLNTAGPRPEEEPVIAQQEAAIDAAVAAGVTHVVKVSALGTAPDLPIPFRTHARIEDHLAGSGITATVLRPSTVMQNFLNGITGFTADGDLLDLHCGGSSAYIDAHDIADCAYAVLTSRAPRGGVHDLTGSRALSSADLAAVLSTALNRSIGVSRPTFDELAPMILDQGLPPWFAEQFVELAKFIAAGGIADITTSVADLLGRPPKSFEEFVAEHREEIGALIPK